MKHRGISGVSRVGHFVTLPQISPQALSRQADFDDGDGRDRKEHPDRTKQDGSSQEAQFGR